MAEKEITLYGPDNKPIRKQELTQEIAAPSMTGVRNIWDQYSVASGLTPDRLAAVLRNAVDGDHHEYLLLAEEMEERDWHYSSVLGTRKRAVTGIEATVEAGSDDAEHQKHADAVRELVRRPEFGDMLDDALDGLGKGYSVSEIIWDRSGKEWQPEEYRHRDPRFFMFDRVNRRTLRLLDDTNTFDGLPLPGYKFIAHVPKLKSGIPIRGGLARLASTAYMCKAFTLADWMAFAEVFGMPLRLGRYGNGATEKDINTLINAVANIGTDAAAVIPDSMRIDFQEAGKSTGGHELFLKLAEWLDKQVSKAVLGQTATTEGTPGKLGSDDAQGEVRKDILIADAKQLGNTLNRDLVKPYIDLNFGPQDNYPRILLQVHEPEDLNALTNALETLVPLGLGVEASWARDKFGIPDPEKGAELLQQAPASMPVPPTATAPNREQICPSCGVAHNQEDTEDPTPSDRIADRMQDETRPVMAQWMARIEAMLASADSLDHFKAMLQSAYADLPDDQLAQIITAGLTAAEAAGWYDVENEEQ